MSTSVYISVAAPTGKSLWARVRKPDGTTAAEGPATETPVGSGVYETTLTPTLTDNVVQTTPHNAEVREGTDAATFNANTNADQIYGRKTNFWVKNAIAIDQPILGNLDLAVSDVSGGAEGDTVNQQETINEVDERIT